MSTHRYKPMLAKEADKAFKDKDWIFEVKWDGFRAIAYINEEISLRSRNQKELIDNFPELNELKQQERAMVLDGEIIVLDKGKVNFQAMLERGKAASENEIAVRTKRSPAAYVVFDILEKDGKPLLDLQLTERKKILKDTLKETEHIILADFVEEKGDIYYEAILKQGLEGLMAKKKSSIYEPGVRSSNWLKIKKLLSCDCAIFGYTEGTGVRKKTFGALILGLFNSKNEPVLVGKVGTGFSEETLEEMMRQFSTLKTITPPFKVDFPEKVVWVEPKLVCEVAYQVVTNDGRLRMPRFLRLRSDKKPSECTIDQLGQQHLEEYAAKRDFKHTSEPKASTKTEANPEKEKIFVVQEHHARRLHYDFRLERDGVLKSWAVPKGIPENSEDKRLAVETEDHPFDYAKFEGEIPKGEYGAGQVVIWDSGTYQTKVWDQKMIEVILDGKKLKGRYVLVPLKKAGEKNWLMLKATQ